MGQCNLTTFDIDIFNDIFSLKIFIHVCININLASIDVYFRLMVLFLPYKMMRIIIASAVVDKLP